MRTILCCSICYNDVMPDCRVRLKYNVKLYHFRFRTVWMLLGVQFIKTVRLTFDGYSIGSGDSCVGALSRQTSGSCRNEAWHESGSNHGTHRS